MDSRTVNWVAVRIQSARKMNRHFAWDKKYNEANKMYNYDGCC